MSLKILAANAADVDYDFGLSVVVLPRNLCFDLELAVVVFAVYVKELPHYL